MPYTPENNPYIPGDPYSYDLNWIVEKVKEAIALYAPLNQKFDDLYDYVVHYIDNLDIDEVVRDKLDEMYDDGTLTLVVQQAFSQFYADAVSYINSRLQAGNRKFTFIGDSYNTVLHHGGWGAQVIAQLELTIGVNAWSSGDGGAGFANGRFLTQLQTLAANMSAAQKSDMTDIVVVGSVNDWSQTNSDIADGVRAFENYCINNFPNSKVWCILAEWGYAPAGLREGTLNAYNAIIETAKYMAVFEDAFFNFLDPALLESDCVHPTANGQAVLGHNIVNILNYGEIYLKRHDTLHAQFQNPQGEYTNELDVKGEITRAGVHVWIVGGPGVNYPNSTVTVPSGSWLTIGNTNLNYLFMDSIEFDGYAMYRKSGAFKAGRAKYRVVHDGDNHTWNLQMQSTEICTGESSFPVSGVNGIYPSFNVMLPIWGN